MDALKLEKNISTFLDTHHTPTNVKNNFNALCGLVSTDMMSDVPLDGVYNQEDGPLGMMC